MLTETITPHTSVTDNPIRNNSTRCNPFQHCTNSNEGNEMWGNEM